MLIGAKKLPIFSLNTIKFLIYFAVRLKQTNVKINKTKKLGYINIA